ncbi:MAG: hypothetical protein ACRD0H_12445, partial [Actinomycetes bacterium]
MGDEATIRAGTRCCQTRCGLALPAHAAPVRAPRSRRQRRTQWPWPGGQRLPPDSGLELDSGSEAASGQA